MGKKKRMVLLVLGIIILGIAIYQYPLQKAFDFVSEKVVLSFWDMSEKGMSF